MGRMKDLHIDIINSKRYQDASEDERRKILEDWEETEEFEKAKQKDAKKK